MGYLRTSLSGTPSPVAKAVGHQPFPEPYHSYGQRSAAIVMASVAGLRGAKKKQALKKTLDTIDPSLWGRAAGYAKQYTAAGAAPHVAVKAGIARAMSAGIVAELVGIGKTGKVPSRGHAALSGYSPRMQRRRGARSALGLVNVGAAQLGPGVAGGAAPISTAGVATGSTDGTCTSDGKLILVGNTWRVRSPTDPCTSNIASEDVNYVIKSGQKIYVGPVLLDPKAGPTVTTIVRPDQLPAKWVPWLQQVIQTSWANCVTQGRCAQCGMAKIDPTLTGPCNQCMDQAKCLSYSGFQNLCTSQTDPKCTTVSSGANKGQPITYEMNRGYTIADPTAASLGATSLAIGKDDNGNQCHVVQYPNDPNTYQFYTASDWSVSTGLPIWCFTQQPNQLVAGLGISIGDLGSRLSAVVSSSDFANENAPLAFFTHPLTGDRWGVWFSLGGGGPGMIGYPSSVGKWDVKSDAPFSYVLQIGFAPYVTDPPWWKEVLQAIFYVPALLFDVIDTAVAAAVSAIGGLACDIATVANAGAAASKAAGGGAAGGLAAGGAAIVGRICNGSTPPPVVQPSSSILPLAIAGVGLLVVFAATRPKKKPKPPASGAP